MTRMFVPLATLALMAVASTTQDATACDRPSGHAACHSSGAPDRFPATLVVRLPADAKLYFGGRPTTSTGPRRLFTTPDLRPGQEFTYTVKAEANRDGETVVMTKQVTVRASETTNVDFGDMGSSGPVNESEAELGRPVKAPSPVPAFPIPPFPYKKP